MQLYYGLLTPDNPRLNGTDYAADGYYLNNFDSYSRALITLFELMVVNNWQVIMFGVVAVTNKWSQIYFLSFYIMTVMVVLNLILAFIVEVYVLKSETNSRTHSWEKEIQRIFKLAQVSFLN